MNNKKEDPKRSKKIQKDPISSHFRVIFESISSPGGVLTGSDGGEKEVDDAEESEGFRTEHVRKPTLQQYLHSLHTCTPK